MATFKTPDVYDSVKRWLVDLEAKSRSLDFEKSSTKRAYLYWLKRYCQYLGKSPDSIIEERMRQLKHEEEMIRRTQEEHVKSFMIELKRAGMAPNSIAVAVGAIRSFYKSSYVDLKKIPTVQIRGVRPYKIPDVKDVKKMVKFAEEDMSAWILTQFNSGLGNTDLLALELNTLSSEFGTIRTQLKKGIVPIHIEIHRQKTGERTDSFWGPNAVEALEKYLTGRTRGKIFGKGMSMRTIQKRVKSIGIRSKVGTKDVPVTPYALRRAFNTLMKLDAMNEALVERMMGHSIGRVRSAYLVTGRDELIEGIPISRLAEEYMNHYKAIDITKV